MLAILFLLLGLVPPLVAGPLAGIAFIEILKRRKPWVQIPFWFLLVLLNLLVMYGVAGSSGVWLPISSLSAFFVTPLASILTVRVMRTAWRRFEATAEVDRARKRQFALGLVLVPGLQIGIFMVLLIYAPWLCKVGLVICKDL